MMWFASFYRQLPISGIFGDARPIDHIDERTNQRNDRRRSVKYHMGR